MRRHYEESGKKGGKPIVYLHGGPGGGIAPSDRQYFDPEVYHAVLFDQRGAGKSTPSACLEVRPARCRDRGWRGTQD